MNSTPEIVRDAEQQQPPAVDQQRLVRLPKWAQAYIRELERRVERAEATIPWTEPGMEWFTLLKDSEPETIFLCDRGGTHAIATIGKGDRVFVGRARKPNAPDQRPAE